MPIDFLKIRTKQVGIKEYLINAFDFKGEFSASTGEVNNEPKLIHQHPQFKIILYHSGGVEFQGSIHKYHNGENFNGNQFTYKNLVESLEKFKTEFGVNLEEAAIHNLEFGVNLQVSKPPQYLIDLFLAYKNKGYDLKSFNGKGYLKDWGSTNYYFIKCYNKSKQYEMDTNVLRFETKYLRMSKIKHSGIKTLQDLYDVSKLTVLGSDLTAILKEMIVVEDLDTKQLTRKELDLYHELKNAQNWANYNPDTRKYRKKQLSTLTAKYGGQIHADLIDLTTNTVGFLLKN